MISWILGNLLRSGDKIRWIPTDHMLVDCMTKNMPPDAMLGYMKTMEYALKYDDVIKETKREIAKLRRKKTAETALQRDGLNELEEKIDNTNLEHVNLVEHSSLCYDMFSLLYPQPKTTIRIPSGTLLVEYTQKKTTHGYRGAYHRLYDVLCTGAISDESSD